MADLRGVACVAGGSETFEETDAGFYVCARCGTQSQDVRKDVDDEDAALSMGLVGRGARSRRVRDPTRARLGADGRVIQRGGDAPKTADDVARERRAEDDEDRAGGNRRAMDPMSALPKLRLRWTREMDKNMLMAVFSSGFPVATSVAVDSNSTTAAEPLSQIPVILPTLSISPSAGISP